MVFHKKNKLRLQIIISIIFLFILFFYLGTLSFKDKKTEEECVKVNSGSNFIFDACYDLATSNIFLDVKRSSYDIYSVKSIRVNFNDGEDKYIDLLDVPRIGESKTFNFPLKEKITKIDLILNISEEGKEFCVEPRSVVVSNCLREIDNSSNPELNKTNYSISFKEDFWRSVCDSGWNCSEWGECLGGVQRRSCVDYNKCSVPVNIPRTNRYCSETCRENWDCEWSECKDRYSIPTCKDLNNCGTFFNKPKKASCSLGVSCAPDIKCDEWSECLIDYSFVDFEERKLFSNITGKRTRVCTDSNLCISSFVETGECLANLDVYTKIINKCSKEYIELYNTLDGKLIARINEASEDSPLKISLGNSDIYCESCYNGFLDGDEIGIDCGGSCKSCSNKSKGLIKNKNGFLDWLRGFF